MRTAVYERKVYYYETDRMDCVHHSNYIRWFEEARIHFMQVWGFPYEELEAGGLVSPVLHAEADYRTMTRFGETVEIEAGVESYNGTRIAFCYTVRNQETGEIRCQGRTVHCFLNPAGRPVSLKKANPAYDSAVRAVMEEGETP